MVDDGVLPGAVLPGAPCGPSTKNMAANEYIHPLLAGQVKRHHHIVQVYNQPVPLTTDDLRSINLIHFCYACACSWAFQVERYLSALRSCYASQGKQLVAF